MDKAEMSEIDHAEDMLASVQRAEKKAQDSGIDACKLIATEDDYRVIRQALEMYVACLRDPA